MSDHLLPPDCWADLLADSLADAHEGLVQAFREAESYRKSYLVALRRIAAQDQEIDALRRALRRREAA